MWNMPGADRHRIPRDLVGLWGRTPLGHTFTPHWVAFGQRLLASGLILLPSRALVVPLSPPFDCDSGSLGTVLRVFLSGSWRGSLPLPLWVVPCRFRW